MTIDGKEFESVMNEFYKPFKESDFDTRDGNFFIPHAVWEKRINDTIGIYNYSHDVRSVSISQIGNSYVLLGESTLTIFDDDGVIVKSITYPCGAEIIVTNESQKCSNFSNSTQRLCQNSLGKGCIMLGVGGQQLRDKKNKNKNSNHNNPSQTKEYRLEFKTAISSLGRNGYKADIVIDGVNEKMELVMFKEAVSSIEQVTPISNFIKIYGPGKHLTITGYEKEFNGKKQIVMESASPKSS